MALKFNPWREGFQLALFTASAALVVWIGRKVERAGSLVSSILLRR